MPAPASRSRSTTPRSDPQIHEPPKPKPMFHSHMSRWHSRPTLHVGNTRQGFVAVPCVWEKAALDPPRCDRSIRPFPYTRSTMCQARDVHHSSLRDFVVVSLTPTRASLKIQPQQEWLAHSFRRYCLALVPVARTGSQDPNLFGPKLRRDPGRCLWTA